MWKYDTGNSSAEPSCDPRLTQPTMSVGSPRCSGRRASDLVQTPKRPDIACEDIDLGSVATSRHIGTNPMPSSASASLHQVRFTRLMIQKIAARREEKRQRSS
jgi:hypothetical protein